MRAGMVRRNVLVGLWAVASVIGQAHGYVALQPESGNMIPKVSVPVSDTTSLGSLVVPSIGMGTISWSSKKCKLESLSRTMIKYRPHS